MAKKNAIEPFAVIAAGDMSGDITSAFTDIRYLDNVAYTVSWDGTSPAGEILVDVTMDDVQNSAQNPSPLWTPLDFGTTISVSGNTGNHILNLTQLGFAFIRLRYDRTSGTGTMRVKIESKSVGS